MLKHFEKKGSKFAKQRGFSLIELSIVLIIIGLLVAGITGGASLINSAELRAVISEARGYQIAVNTYFVQKDEMPGDDPSGTGGDGDGNIEFIGTVVTAAQHAEGVYAWTHLVGAGVVDTTVSAYIPDGTAVDLDLTMVPKSKSKGNGWFFEYGVAGTDIPAGTNTGNYLSLFRPDSTLFVATAVTNTITADADLASLNLEDTTQIDTKVDDADLDSGKVIARESNAATVCTANCIPSFSVDI